MMDNIILGRYVSGNSIIHCLDPRSKLIAMFSFVLIVFWANNWITNFILFLFVFWGVYLSKISFNFFLSGLKSMMFFIAFTNIFQLFFTDEGEAIIEFWIIKVTDVGLARSGIIFSRFVLIIFFSTILTLTTTPLSLSAAIESLLKPLSNLKVPVHEIGFMLSLSLRFVPTLMADTIKIMNSQRARGVDFNEGSFIKKVKSIAPVLVPLFVSSFKRADHLATAMEARGYKGGDGRSKYRILKWSGKDSLLLFLIFILGLSLFILKD